MTPMLFAQFRFQGTVDGDLNSILSEASVEDLVAKEYFLWFFG
jgi:hypothetical protein